VIEVSFYHLQRTSLEEALPSLLEKVLEKGFRALVLAGSDERVEALNTALWTYDPGSFLPHGGPKDGSEEGQPIYLTTDPDSNPNGAEVLVQVDGSYANDFSGFMRILDIFNGNDPEALAATRSRWKSLKDAGYDLAYWQQGSTGGWQKKDST
jgi:DNA polymerase-3 subunit chi